MRSIVVIPTLEVIGSSCKIGSEVATAIDLAVSLVYRLIAFYLVV